MKRAKRTFTQDEKDLVFNLWKQGAGFSDIGRVLRREVGREPDHPEKKEIHKKSLILLIKPC